MNTPTPTPRTDAAWSSSFEPCEYRAAHTARTMRECSQQLETELATELERATHYRDQWQRVTSQLTTLTDERDAAITRAERAEASLAAATEECTDVRLKWHAVMGMCAAKEDSIMAADEELARLRARAEAERNQLRAEVEAANKHCDILKESNSRACAEVERLRSDRDCEKRLRKDAEELREDAIERAMKAKADLVALEQCHDDNCRGLVRIADDLATERARTKQIATALTDAISTYFGADKLVTAERIEAWQAALKEDAT